MTTHIGLCCVFCEVYANKLSISARDDECFLRRLLSTSCLPFNIINRGNIPLPREELNHDIASYGNPRIMFGVDRDERSFSPLPGGSAV